MEKCKRCGNNVKFNEKKYYVPSRYDSKNIVLVCLDCKIVIKKMHSVIKTVKGIRGCIQ